MKAQTRLNDRFENELALQWGAGLAAWGQRELFTHPRLQPRSGRPRRSSRRRPSYEKGLPCFPRRAEAHERGATSCQCRKAVIPYARTAGGVPPRPSMGGTAPHGGSRRLSRVWRKTAGAFGGQQGPSVETAPDDCARLPRCIPWRSNPSQSLSKPNRENFSQPASPIKAAGEPKCASQP